MAGDNLSIGGGTASEKSDEEADEVPKSKSKESAKSSSGDLLEKLLKQQTTMFENVIFKRRRKRKRGEEDEDDSDEDVVAGPVLIDVEHHHLKDDAHTVLDWVARSVRPYNGGDQEAYWAKRPRRDEPVLEDLKMAHLTKVPINPAVLAKAHDRGAETTAKQWLSTNYSVRSNDCKMRATDKGTAGAFFYDFQEPKGVWESVDAVFNYTMALMMIRPDDWTGILVLRTLHECRYFCHPQFDARTQKELIMAFFDQVLDCPWKCFGHKLVMIYAPVE